MKMACIYKTVTLQNGEKFALPSGAELVGASDSNLITSTCALPTLETLGCYALVFGNAEDDGNASQIFEATTYSNTPVKGINFNQKDYDFLTTFPAGVGTGLYDLAAIVSAINSTSLGTLIFDASVGYNNQLDYGVMSYIVFKTVPSIANNLALTMYTYAPDIDPLYFSIPVLPYADVSGYNSIPACSLTLT